MTDEPRRDDWHIGGRYYLAWTAGDLDRDGMVLEVEDVAPAPGRGDVIHVFYSDATREMTFSALTTEPLPLELVERAIDYARRVLPPAPTSGK